MAPSLAERDTKSVGSCATLTAGHEDEQSIEPVGWAVGASPFGSVARGGHKCGMPQRGPSGEQPVRIGPFVMQGEVFEAMARK